MNTSPVFVFITQSGHLIGLLGVVVCLALLYYQIFRVFSPRPGNWRSYRISRLLLLVQRFLWLTWLCGISLLMTANIFGPQWQQSHILFDKLFALFLLSLTTVGLDFLVRRLFSAYQGGKPVISGWREGVLFKVCFALSIAVWTVILFMAWSYTTDNYSSGLAIVSGLSAFVVVVCLLLAVSNKWLNAVTAGDFRK